MDYKKIFKGVTSLEQTSKEFRDSKIKIEDDDQKSLDVLLVHTMKNGDVHVVVQKNVTAIIANGEREPDDSVPDNEGVPGFTYKMGRSVVVKGLTAELMEKRNDFLSGLFS